MYIKRIIKSDMDTINLQPSMEDVVPISWHSFANIVARQCQYCGKSVPLHWQQHVNGWWIE
ncbi:MULTISPECIES: hypothetical protein [Bacteroides]|uniref:hypothetical protein n=1 Tax=Bacteroides TaxID=816 RepID=UPI000E441AE0|nr:MULTISPECIES: hypothetical protein [Bacteroides]RGM50105.1 hypothetical protein DXC10_02140 [Bacteroides sp. OM08-11]